jgi:PTS system N-acetylgalactosamine-specific IIA component
MTSSGPEAPPASLGGAARALVIGHGDFAAGVVSAVVQIAGRGELFVPLSNRGLGAEDIERLLADTADATGARVIFTDLPAGSATLAARRLLRARPELVLVVGANVATLLDFAFHDDLAPDDAARAAAEKGRAALLVVAPPAPRPSSNAAVGGADGD